MNEFKSRLSVCYDEMKWLYMELYNNDEQAFDYFIYMLEEYYKSRSSELKAWDKKRTSRSKKSSWYKDNKCFGMLAYADCFADTLSGVRSHLSYIKELGVNYLHLMPILKSPVGRSDGGYAVSDFRCIDEHLGTIDDLEALSNDCHRENISLCLDFVMNHTSEDHEWAIRAKKGEREYQDRYFFFDNWNIPNEFSKTMPEVFPTTAPGNFTWCEEAGKVVMTTFYPYQWDLNYKNPVVFNDMTANMLFMCNCGVDIIRLDATPYIWKTLGTKCRNLPQVHSLVRLMHMACDIVCPGTLLLGEVVMEPKEVVPYFGSIERPECHLLYNVTTMASIWHTVATKDVRLLADQLSKVFSLPKEYVFLNYLRCHDDIGWGLDYAFLKQFGIEEIPHKKFLNDYFRNYIFESGSRGELYNDDKRLGDARLCGTTASLCGIEEGENKNNPELLRFGITLDIMLHAFLFTLSGIPILYSGDEIGQLNDYSYKDDPLKRQDSRYLHRGKFDWKSAGNRKNKNTREGSIYFAIKEIEKTRSKHKVFMNEADTWIITLNTDSDDHSVLGIGRYYDGEKLLAFFNFSRNARMVYTSENDLYKEIASSSHTESSKENLICPDSFLLPGNSFIWFLMKY
ncbi:MAG: alpha-amylase family protein [Lachnospiraceae bacterium]|nr:alpha-amylase family protein [Lachnospiraceae bacterium]